MQYLTYISINVPNINTFPFKNIWVIVRKQNFNQNFNLIMDAASPSNRQPAILTKANLLAEIFKCIIVRYNHCYLLISDYLQMTKGLYCVLMWTNLKPLHLGIIKWRWLGIPFKTNGEVSFLRKTTINKIIEYLVIKGVLIQNVHS